MDPVTMVARKVLINRVAMFFLEQLERAAKETETSIDDLFIDVLKSVGYYFSMGISISGELSEVDKVDVGEVVMSDGTTESVKGHMKSSL